MRVIKNEDKRIFQVAFSIIYIIIFSNKNAYGETTYIPPDPFLILGEREDYSTAEEITKKISKLQDQNKEMRARILSLQDTLISRFKDRIELKIVITTEQEKELPQFGIIELSAIINNISLINYKKPVFFERNMYLPIFHGPLPIGTYEVKIHAIVGQQSNNWPYALPQGKWSVDKKITINGTLKSSIHNIKLALKPNNESGIPQFEELTIENTEVKK